MKKIFVLLFLIGSVSIVNAQKADKHVIVIGETLQEIIAHYKISPYELYLENPLAKTSLSVGDTLHIPLLKKYPYNERLVAFKKHKVKRKETLTRLSENYGVSVADIKKYNTFLYAQRLKKGRKLSIPVFDDALYETPIITQPEAIIHIVKAKESKYGIAKKYKLSIAELENENPQIISGLQIGQQLRIPFKQPEELYAYYTVQPKEGFYRLTKTLGISKDSLIALNPSLKDGIRLGMQLKYPKKIAVSEIEKVLLKDMITNYQKQNLTLMLPFGGHKIIKNDTVSNLERLVLKDGYVNASLDFYSGVLMAIDSVKQLGISIRLRVFDTEYSRNNTAGSQLKIASILSQPFEDNEIVLGPLVFSNFKNVATALSSKNIPVVAPLPLKRPLFLNNVIETATTISFQRKQMIAYISTKIKGKQIIIVADKKMTAVKNELLLAFPNASVITSREDDLLIPEDFEGILSKEKENVVILESSSVSLVATVTSILDTKIKDHTISLYTTSSKKMFDSDAIANRYKSKLNFHFPSISKPMVFEEENSFVIKYTKTYGKLPSKLALRGFDVTLDLMLRNALEVSLYKGLQVQNEAEYIENIFNYNNSESGCITNSALYILKYTPELIIEEVLQDIIEKK